MVKILESSGRSDNLPHPNSASNGSCSAEAIESSHHDLEVSAVNGNSGDKMPVKENAWKNVNGKCISKLHVNEMPVRNGNNYNMQAIKKAATVNGYSKKVLENNATTVNDFPGNKENSTKDVSANVSTLNGHSDLQNEVLLYKEHCDKNGETYSYSSNTPSESGCSNVSDSLYPEDQAGFIEVVNKKRNKNRQQNHRKKQSSNLPPVQNAESIKRDSRNDKKLCEKLSSTHLSQNTPHRHFNAVRTSGKSYSSALLNRQNSGLRNGVSSDSQGVTNCAKSNDSGFPGTLASEGQILTNTAKNTKNIVTNGIIAMKCKQSNSSIKVEMSDVSAQTDVCIEKEMPPSQKECLSPCEEMIKESEKSNSPFDFIDETDYAKESTDEPSNATYCESVVSNDSGRGDSEVPYDVHNPYFCEFPSDKVRNLIGKYGSYKYEIENRTGATFWVFTEIKLSENKTLIGFTGPETAIEKAKELIKRRFRNITLKRWFSTYEGTPRLSDVFAAKLPQGIEFLAVVSCIFTPNYFWLQQFGHPVYHPLENLERNMSNHFNTIVDAPGVVNPMEGHVVAVPALMPDGSTKWVRGEIIRILESGNVITRYLDHGGETEVPATEIRPMRREFLYISFFAAKCCLHGVVPPETTWSEEACEEFKRLCNDVHPPLVRVVSTIEDGYFVSITGFDMETNMRVDVAEMLLRKGLARTADQFFLAPEPANEVLQ